VSAQFDPLGLVVQPANTSQQESKPYVAWRPPLVKVKVAYDYRQTSVPLSPSPSPPAAIFLHGLADAMPGEPSGFHAAIEHPLDLTGGDAFLAATEQVDDLQATSAAGGGYPSKMVPIRTVKGFLQV